MLTYRYLQPTTVTSKMPLILISGMQNLNHNTFPSLKVCNDEAGIKQVLYGMLLGHVCICVVFIE